MGDLASTERGDKFIEVFEDQAVPQFFDMLPKGETQLNIVDRYLTYSPDGCYIVPAISVRVNGSEETFELQCPAIVWDVSLSTEDNCAVEDLAMALNGFEEPSEDFVETVRNKLKQIEE